MRHFRQWQRKALLLCKEFQTGSQKQRHRITGSIAGSCKKGGHSTSTIAYTLMIPLSVRRYSLSGVTNGKTYLTKWGSVKRLICGYVQTELITVKGIAYCKLTRKEYILQSQLTCRAILQGVKISTLLTQTPHIFLPDGGGHPGKQPIY